MRAVSRGSRMPAAILLTVILFIAPGRLLAQTGSSCRCQDVSDLLNQLNLANAALNEIQKSLKTVKPTDYVNEIPPPPNPPGTTNGNILLSAISGGMAQVRNDKANKASMTIDTATCETAVQADTPCLKSLLEVYGSERRKQCLGEKTKRKLGRNDDTMNGYSMHQYLLSLGDAYEALIREILKRLEAMDRSCRPGDWFGSITVSETKSMNIRIETPARNRFDKGTEEVTNDITIRSGVIRLNGSAAQPFSSWLLGGTYNYNKVHQGLVDCDSGPAEELTAFTSGEHTQGQKSGGGSLNTEVGIGLSEDGRSFNISFTIPDITGSLAFQKTVAGSGGCPGYADTKTYTLPATDTTVSSESIQFQGAAFPGKPERISGSAMIDFLEGVPSSDGVILEHTAHVACSLYRFK